MPRRPTSTSAFGVSRRESHDASGFYSRFTPPVISADEVVHPDKALDKLVVGDARRMEEVADASVALVVTSPPYFAGKEYEAEIGARGIPADYLEYLDLLRDVFAECLRKLEPGGRVAVNVANLGRRPYRSLSADVTSILQDDLRMLLRGEIVWVKQRGSSGSCAWGSFRQPTNPVLRDTTERIVVASKGRFDRALSVRRRRAEGLPWESSMTTEDFMENTLDVWEIPAESATRIGHPAPFPTELVARLIDLYTYRGDLVLDPFTGSGTAAVAAIRRGRHYVGYDVDQNYVRLAEGRVAAETGTPGKTEVPSSRGTKDVARELLVSAGMQAVEEERRYGAGVSVSFSARDRSGQTWLFDVAGSYTSYRPGLARTDVLWRAVGKAAVLSELATEPLALLAAGLPLSGSPAAKALASVVGPGRPIYVVVDITSPSAIDVIRRLER
jgi:site-specific DNA-methyltransferase (adenine-specific)